MPAEQSLVPASISAQMRRQYTQHRQTFEKLQGDITKYVEANTAKEQEDFRRATEALQAKRRALLQDKQLREKQRLAEDAQDGMRDVEHQLVDLQRKAYRKIRHMDVPEERKAELWEQVERGVERVLYSEDEIQAVAQLRRDLKRSLGAGGAGGARVMMLCG